MQKKNWAKGFGWRWAASTGSNTASMEHHFFAECSGENEEGRGRSLCGNGRGSWGAPICTSGSGNDGELKGIREEVSSWLYVSLCSGVREWRRRRSS